MTDELPFENCYAVPDCALLAGEYPFHKEREPGRARIRALLDAGVSVFIDLTEAGEYRLQAYETTLREEAESRGVDVAYHRLAIRDMSVPPRAKMRRILDAIAAANARGRKAYVHCWGGAGRTGVVVGCWLRERGLTGDDALARVGELFATMPKSRTPEHRYGSPQTDEQREYVRRWPDVG